MNGAPNNPEVWKQTKSTRTLVALVPSFPVAYRLLVANYFITPGSSDCHGV